MAIEKKDYATHTFLQWFLKEQVEEEATANEIVTRLEMVGSDKGALLLVDRELAERKAN